MPKHVKLRQEKGFEVPAWRNMFVTTRRGLRAKLHWAGLGRLGQGQNLRVLMEHYDQWMDRLMPSMALDDVVETIEKLGHRAAVRVFPCVCLLFFGGGGRGEQPERNALIAAPAARQEFVVRQRTEFCLRQEREEQQKRAAEEGPLDDGGLRAAGLVGFCCRPWAP
jgi:hypothetical protein